MSKLEAEDKLADILAPINGDQDLPSSNMKFDDFVKQVYLPFYRRKWKKSTEDTSVDVNLNVYTKTALGLRKQALDAMESVVSGA
jgi:hypothetical protein